MSKTSDYGAADLDQINQRAGADLRLRLLTLKDLAHAFLEELGTVGDGEPGAEAAEGPIDFYEEVRRFEVELIQSALRRTSGVQTEAASLLGLKPSTLHAKIKQYGLSASDYGPSRVATARARDSQREGAARGAYAEESSEEKEDGRVLALA